MKYFLLIIFIVVLTSFYFLFYLDGLLHNLEPGSFVFTAVGDYHYNQHGVNESLRAVRTSRADFNLAIGDLSYGEASEEDWCRYVKLRLGSNFPFELLSGNHEDGVDVLGNGLIDNFIQCLPNRMEGMVGEYGRQYYFDYPADVPLARFILISPGLNFKNGGKYDYSKNSTRYKWVADSIDSARKEGVKWIVVGTHMNCISTATKKCEIGKDIFNLLISKKVDLVLQAHEHGYQRSKQLKLSSKCTAIIPDVYNPNCIQDDGVDGIYKKDEGSVIVIAGMASNNLYDINEKDSENRYFTAWMGKNKNPTSGIAKFIISSSKLSAEFIRSYGGNFSDSFVIE